MNTYNGNFLSEELDIDDVVDEAVDDALGETQTDHVLTEVMKRIEQAKLYEALLKHDLFGPGSARPEIIRAVKKEFKDFIHSRLEILLGIRTEQVSPQSAPSPFSEEEVMALKAIAARLTSTKKANPTPTGPVINTVMGSSATRIEVPQVKVDDNGATDALRYTAGPQKKKPGSKKRTENSSELTGQDYSQAVNPRQPPKKMPSQAEIDQINARTATINSGNGGGGGEVSKILGLAIAHAQNANKNVKED